ncbi:MAG: SMP-30/gluconolactonase/LRE family protein [Acetobacteraceae bacterium]|nr:SMP-30/gluconolactonase/LRE family protein [Acetobacteraceae bacterium]
MPEIELLLRARATIAESLLWDPGAGVLYWADIKAPALYRLDPTSLEQRRWSLPADIGAFALLDEGTALVALRTGLHALSLVSGSLELLAAAPFDPQRFRFNEGACDAAGRFWVGSMFDPVKETTGPHEPGPLNAWTAATGLVAQPDRGKCHNGMAWSPDGRTFYLAHSQDRVIYAFAFELETGRLGSRRVFARVSNGVPDGAAVDEEGAYWCAMHGAGCLRRYAPDGSLLRSVPLPVSQPTMCAFGGPDLRTLFVSSASDHLSPEQHAREPLAGSLFRFDPGVRGLPKPYLAR